MSEFLSFRIIPESLRWLLSKGKVIHGSPTILANPSKVEILQGELDLLKKRKQELEENLKKVGDEDVFAGETRGSRGRLLPLLQLT